MVARVSSTVVWSPRTDGFRARSSVHAAMASVDRLKPPLRGEGEVLTDHRADGPLSSFDRCQTRDTPP